MPPMLVLYVVPGCPLCAEVREWLARDHVDYVERNVAADFCGLRRMYKLTRNRLVPVVEFGGRAVVRPSREQVQELMVQSP